MSWYVYAVLAEVAKLDGRLGGRCRVRGFGPIPPYSFVAPAGEAVPQLARGG
jgi:hypothetical protein